MNIGPNWPFPFDVLGHGIPGGQSYKADSGFPLPGINSYCAIVLTENITWFQNSSIPSFSAGVSVPDNYAWLVGVNESGFVDLVYNDNKFDDNNGDLHVILNIMTGS